MMRPPQRPAQMQQKALTGPMVTHLEDTRPSTQVEVKVLGPR